MLKETQNKDNQGAKIAFEKYHEKADKRSELREADERRQFAN